MTPKEKAQELVEAMAFSCRECDYEAKAKQYALIAVDEIIGIIPYEKRQRAFIDAYYRNNTSYWQEVKQEIENL